MGLHLITHRTVRLTGYIRPLSLTLTLALVQFVRYSVSPIVWCIIKCYRLCSNCSNCFFACLALPLAVLGPRVGRTMNRRSPCRSVVHFSDCIFELQSHPWSDIVYPRCFRSSSFSIATLKIRLIDWLIDWLYQEVPLTESDKTALTYCLQAS